MGDKIYLGSWFLTSQPTRVGEHGRTEQLISQQLGERERKCVRGRAGGGGEVCSYTLKFLLYYLLFHQGPLAYGMVLTTLRVLQQPPPNQPLHSHTKSCAY